MKPLNCPQCGGKITDYAAWQSFATCLYCETKFLIEPEKPRNEPRTSFVEPAALTRGANPNAVVFGIMAALILIGGSVLLLGFLVARKNEKPARPAYSPPYSAPTPRFSPTPTATPRLNLLEFGGKGTGDGLFQEADEIAVDSKGRIYVADETMRVQQFSETGGFLKVWQVPSETGYYKRARSIEKIRVDDRDRLYVLVAGIVLIYEPDSSRPQRLVHFAPNPVQDFAFRSDGGKLYLVNGENTEYLIQVTETGKTVRRVNGFHTKAADASMSPAETGLAAIRIAVDGAGNIFSVYAFGDLGSYQLSYNADELMIFRFTPEGRYVNKFVETMNSCGIEVDNQSRVYVSNNDSINVYSNNGQHLSAIGPVRGIDAFTLDKQNNVYILKDDQVIKRAAID